jgi:hypothetical protein
MAGPPRGRHRQPSPPLGVTIDPVAAAVAGVVAGQLMEAPTYLQRAAGLGVKQDIFDEAGAILRAPRRLRRLVGWVGHAVLAIGIVLLYTTFFAAVAHNDHLAWWGILAGAVHGLLGGVVVGAWPDLHPEMPDPKPAPGGSTDATAAAMWSASSSATCGSAASPG